MRLIAVAAAISILAAAAHATAQDVIYAEQTPFTIEGRSEARPGTAVTVTIGSATVVTAVRDDGSWATTWTAPLSTGTYEVSITIDGATETRLIRLQHDGNVQRHPGVARARPEFAPALPPEPLLEEITDRWRIAAPPYELDEVSKGRFDPYNRNILKGDLPIDGDDTFLVLSGTSDSLVESRSLPTPAGAAPRDAGTFRFFGDDAQGMFLQNVLVSADIYEGNTTFQPVRQRLKLTLAANLNHVRVAENGVLKPDTRRGNERTAGHLAIQEVFYERKLRDLSVNFDFLSLRAGVQPFASDFRGLVFADTTLGIRLFGNYASNRFQYNLAFFERLEKETNSGLNVIGRLRGARVAVANVYWQDFPRPGHTQQFSLHHMRDDADVTYDRNGVLVRPAPVGDAAPHAVHATYLGAAGQGHLGRINVDHAIYYVFGRDTHNPIAGSDPNLQSGDAVRVRAAMAAAEISWDRDWLRPRVGIFYATGDSKPRDRTARGFDAIVDAPTVAGGGFSFFNRMGITLPATGVSLVERGSLLPALRSSKFSGQPNYVNPGLTIVTAGVDAELTPRLEAQAHMNYIRLNAVEPLEQLLFQSGIAHDLGVDTGLGLRYRPFLSNNVVIAGGLATLIPGEGFEDIYDTDDPLYHSFLNVTLTF